MADATRGARWLSCRERRPEAAIRLYCFPHSGGSVGEFVRWADDLPNVEVLGIQLPGRGGRHREAPFTRMDPLVAAIVEAVAFRGPFAFFGHSLGTLVAYEVARTLRAAGLRQPDWLFVSAYQAPHVPRTDPPIHHLPDDELIAWIHQEYGSLPANISDDAELVRLVLPSHRADFEIVETYKHTSGEPLDCPITVIGGTEDEVSERELAAWGQHTIGPTHLHWLPGDHFYLRQQRDRLLRIVTDSLASIGNHHAATADSRSGRMSWRP
jgi:surfactin synthase thioesterase subunit